MLPRQLRLSSFLVGAGDVASFSLPPPSSLLSWSLPGELAHNHVKDMGSTPGAAAQSTEEGRKAFFQQPQGQDGGPQELGGREEHSHDVHSISKVALMLIMEMKGGRG